VTTRATDPTARRVLRAFEGAGVATRLHTLLRHLTAPFSQLEAMLPREGRVRDFGCGHGVFALYLALAAPDRQVLGVDIDERKLELADHAARRLGVQDRVRFEEVDEAWAPAGSEHDSVVCVDVAYLLGTGRFLDLLDQFAEVTPPGGVVLVKEMGEAPPWKRRVLEAQERLATGPLGLTMGSHVEWVAMDAVESTLRRRGLQVERLELDRLHVHPHLAVVGRRGS